MCVEWGIKFKFSFGWRAKFSNVQVFCWAVCLTRGSYTVCVNVTCTWWKWNGMPHSDMDEWLVLLKFFSLLSLQPNECSRGGKSNTNKTRYDNNRCRRQTTTFFSSLFDAIKKRNERTSIEWNLFPFAFRKLLHYFFHFEYIILLRLIRWSQSWRWQYFLL